MSHPGVGALAFVLIIGTPERFARGKQLSSYLGLVSSEESSGERRRLTHISKQGNSLLRFLLVQAAQATVRSDADWRTGQVNTRRKKPSRGAAQKLAR